MFFISFFFLIVVDLEFVLVCVGIIFVGDDLLLINMDFDRVLVSEGIIEFCFGICDCNVDFVFCFLVVGDLIVLFGKIDEEFI